MVPPSGIGRGRVTAGRGGISSSAVAVESTGGAADRPGVSAFVTALCGAHMVSQRRGAGPWVPGPNSDVLVPGFRCWACPESGSADGRPSCGATSTRARPGRTWRRRSRRSRGIRRDLRQPSRHRRAAGVRRRGQSQADRARDTRACDRRRAPAPCVCTTVAELSALAVPTCSAGTSLVCLRMSARVWRLSVSWWLTPGFNPWRRYSANSRLCLFRESRGALHEQLAAWPHRPCGGTIPTNCRRRVGVLTHAATSSYMDLGRLPEYYAGMQVGIYIGIPVAIVIPMLPVQ